MNRLGAVLSGGLIAGLLVTLVTGCGAGGATSKLSKGHATTGPVSISFMQAMSSGALSTSLQHLVAQFESSHPSITVNLLPEASFAVLHTDEEAAVAAGNPPTIGQVQFSSWAASYAAAKAIIPLTQFMQGANGITPAEKNAFYSGVWHSTLLPDGKVWMWPFAVSDLVLFYNANLVAADGVAVPKTWAEFATTAAKVTHGGHWAFSTDPGSATSAEDGSYLYLALISAFGGQWVVNGRPSFDSGAAVKAAEYLRSLVKAGEVTVGSNYPGTTALGALRAVFHPAVIVDYSYDTAALGSKARLGVAPFPSGPAGPGNFLLAGNNVIFAKTSTAQRDAAWTFLKWLEQPAQTAYWSEQTGYLPVSKAAEPLMKTYDSSHPVVSSGIAGLSAATATPPYAWFTQADGDLNVALESILLNGASPSAALHTAEQQALAVELSVG